MWKRISVTSLSVLLLAMYSYHGSFEKFIFISFGAVLVGLGIFFGIVITLRKGKKYKVPEKENMATIASVILQKMVEMHKNFHPCERRTVVSRNIDAAIQEIMDLTIRDYIMTWYSELAKDSERFPHIVEDEFWHIIENLYKRLQKLDTDEFMTRDILSTLHKHFLDMREASFPSEKVFVLHPWLSSSEEELNFLRTIADVLLIHLLPEEYSKVQSVRHLLKEILACTMLRPMLDTVSNPDYINQALEAYLDRSNQTESNQKPVNSPIETFDSFMEKIQKCNDVEELQQIRHNIISEIIQATAIQQIRKAKGEDMAKNLHRYLNQLTICKNFCEKRIKILGGPDYKCEQHGDCTSANKVLSFAVVMQTEGSRNHFFKHLMNSNNDDLLRFWAAVENMKHTTKNKWHKQAVDMFDKFFKSHGSLLRLHFDKSIIRRMEAFMTGDMGPDAFHEAQDQVYKILEEHFYPSFIVSDLYSQYMGSSDCKSHIPSLAISELSEKLPESSVSALKNIHKDTVKIVEHSTYAQSKLQCLEEKFENKSQALHALKLSQKHEPKILKLREEIESEIETLKQERKELEFHIERTDLWAANLGKWKSHIYNNEVVECEGRKFGFFVIVVHLPGMLQQMEITGNPVSPVTQGWVISRKLEDFLALHKKLVQMKPILKTLDLSFSKIRQKDITEAKLNEIQDSLEDYLVTILQDERLAQSEDIFAFFSPSPEHLKQPQLNKVKEKHSLPNFFKNSATNEDCSDSDDELVFAENASIEKEDGKANDSSAGHLYRLIGEVFEIKGVFKWFRKTFIVFVKMSFGKSVNRQLRGSVNWMFSEPMIVFYLNLFRESYWPNGHLAEQRPHRSDEQKIHTRFKAKEKFIDGIPDLLQNLVGEKNAKQGALKIFEALQERKLNKHLLYNILLLLMYEIFPEISEYDEQDEKDSTGTS